MQFAKIFHFPDFAALVQNELNPLFLKLTVYCVLLFGPTFFAFSIQPATNNQSSISKIESPPIYNQNPGLTIQEDTARKSPDSTQKGNKWTLQPGNWEAFPLGDINKDRKQDTAFVFTPAYWEEIDSIGTFFGSCENDSCYNRIRFSTHFPEIYEGMSLWGQVETIGDLNGDHIKEIVIQKSWWIGSHVTIHIYSFLKGKWKLLAQDNLYFQKSYKNRIRKIDNRSFWFLDEIMIDGDYLSKRRKVTIGKFFDGID
jgi:hypothetical protein